MRSDWTGPVNHRIGRRVTINQFAALAARIADKRITIRHVRVRWVSAARARTTSSSSRSSNRSRAHALEYGMRRTYDSIDEQVRLRRETA
jgi:hypothetical protein